MVLAKFNGEMHELPLGTLYIKKDIYKAYIEKKKNGFLKKTKFLNVDKMNQYKAKKKLYEDACDSFNQEASYIDNLSEEAKNILQKMYYNSSMVNYLEQMGDYVKANEIIDEFLKQILSITTIENKTR